MRFDIPDQAEGSHVSAGEGADRSLAEIGQCGDTAPLLHDETPRGDMTLRDPDWKAAATATGRWLGKPGPTANSSVTQS
jgi:hypothetical protein